MIGAHSTRERGQVVVVFALLVPMLLALGAFVVGIGNWYTHAKNLQTKADASALAGGGVWSFPCVETTTSGPTTSQKIANEARIFVGPHIQASGTPFNGTTFNEQVGHVPGSKIHVVLNGSAFYDNDSNPLPTELNDPANASICNSKILDVKVTEDDTFPLLSVLPLFPDIKRKARVQIEQVEGLNNLLPIAVRVPSRSAQRLSSTTRAAGRSCRRSTCARRLPSQTCRPDSEDGRSSTPAILRTTSPRIRSARHLRTSTPAATRRSGSRSH